MPKDFVVTFSVAGARILKGIDPKEWEGKPGALVNPTRPLGVPPHRWVLNDDRTIGTIDQDEYDRRNPDGPTAVPSVPVSSSAPPRVVFTVPAWAKWAVGAAAIAAVGAAVYFLA